MNTSFSTSPELAVRYLAESQKIVVFSGAGLSAGSGLPTYRDGNGLWETGDTVKYAQAATYKQDPKAFGRFWRDRLESIGKVEPNAAHSSIQVLQALKPELTLVTQNVDGLLQDAGCKDVLELHGSVRRNRCGKCSATKPFLFHRCMRCFGHVRPDVVLFDEPLDSAVISLAMKRSTKCDLMLVIGTSAAVYPAAELPHHAKTFGAKIVVVDPNPAESLLQVADVVLKERAEVIVPLIIERSFDL